MEQSPNHPTHVVTNFLIRNDRGHDEVLLVRRSQRVRTYKGAWGGISGYLEANVTPREQALTEIREETGLRMTDADLRVEGEPLPVEDRAQGLSWIVHPFLVVVPNIDQIVTDWEADEMRWVRPEDVASLPTVPKLAEALAEVYSPPSPT